MSSNGRPSNSSFSCRSAHGIANRVDLLVERDEPHGRRAAVGELERRALADVEIDGAEQRIGRRGRNRVDGELRQDEQRDDEAERWAAQRHGMRFRARGGTADAVRGGLQCFRQLNVWADGLPSFARLQSSH